MTTQHLDNAQIEQTCHISLHQHQPHSYYVEVPATPIDEQSRQVSQLIDLAFDTLGVRHLDVRVIGADTDLVGPPALPTVPSTRVRRG